MSLLDENLLPTDLTFLKRIQSAVIAASVAISTDGQVTALALKRHAQVVQILAAPSTWAILFAQTIAASDPTTINQATNNGAVSLTPTNLASQAALITDATITNAVSSAFNSFFGGQ